MPGEIYNIVKLVPKPGKLTELVDAFKIFAKYIEDHETKTQLYFAVQPAGTEELVLIEKYTDAENLKEHAGSSAFKQFGRTIGPLLAEKPHIKGAAFVGGIVGRAKL